MLLPVKKPNQKKHTGVQNLHIPTTAPLPVMIIPRRQATMTAPTAVTAQAPQTR